MATTNLLHCQRHNRSWQGDGTDAPQGCPWCEVERLRAARSQSCEDNRSVALAEPNRTRTCPLERELRAEIERLKALVVERWTNEHQSALDRILQLHIDDLQSRLDAAEVCAEHRQTMSLARQEEVERLRAAITAIADAAGGGDE